MRGDIEVKVRSSAIALMGAALLVLAGCSAAVPEAPADDAPEATAEETTAPESSGTDLPEACGAVVAPVAELFGSGEYSATEVAFPAGWTPAFPGEVVDAACAVEVTPSGGDAQTWVAFAASESELDAVFDVTKLDGYEASGNTTISAGVAVLGLRWICPSIPSRRASRRSSS